MRRRHKKRAWYRPRFRPYIAEDDSGEEEGITSPFEEGP
jgi:hypothetical protein